MRQQLPKPDFETFQITGTGIVIHVTIGPVFKEITDGWFPNLLTLLTHKLETKLREYRNKKE